MKPARWLVFAVLLLAACTPAPSVERYAFFALGTLVEISVFAPPSDIDTALRAVEQALLEEEQRWRAWETGELAALNQRLATGEPVTIEPALLEGINRARELAATSGGRFNPAIGRAVALWKFHVEERGDAPVPTDDALTALLPPPQLDALVERDDGKYESRDARLWIDMGAFAKGLAVERAVRTLREHGIANAIVNAGGDLKVIGRHGERDWRIGVRHPRGAGVLAALRVQAGESVFTSGDYERGFTFEGVRYHHILDPATARPARGVASVTIIHTDAALADAAATALFVAGQGEWRQAARDLGIDKAMLVLDDGSVELTSAMQARVAFEDASLVVTVFAP